VLSDFLKAIYQSVFARSISNLLNSGVSIVDAVNITARAINNVVYKDKIKLIAKDVAQGITISESIQDSPYFSNLTTSMLAVGEKTAQVDELSRKIAEYYEAKTANMADNFSKLIQPFIIALVGGLVGAIVLAIMLPMTKLLSGIDSL
jgi:type IV pilus assembly protein PilC